MGQYQLSACHVHAACFCSNTSQPIATISEQAVDNFEYELPSDFEDEEIDEEAAFTEEDKKLYADWFPGGDAEEPSAKPAGDAGQLNSEEEAEEGESGEYNTDDFSEEVSALWCYFHMPAIPASQQSSTHAFHPLHALLTSCP